MQSHAHVVNSDCRPIFPLLTQAHAGAYFAGRVLDGLNGTKNVKECTFVECDLTDAPFFASPVSDKLGLLIRKVGSGQGAYLKQVWT